MTLSIRSTPQRKLILLDDGSVGADMAGITEGDVSGGRVIKEGRAQKMVVGTGMRMGELR